MKILIVAPYYLPYISGMTTYCRELAEGLAKKHEVTILTLKHLKNLKKKEVLNNVEILRVPILFKFQRGAYSICLLPTLIKIINKFDVVNVHAPFFEVGPIVLISKLYKKKVILTYHCDLSLRNSILSSLVEKMYYFSIKLATKLADKIVVNSIDFLKASRIKKYAKKAAEIFPPINTSKFRKVKVSEKFRKKYSIEKSDFVVGFLGRITREKGLEYLIKAIPMINKKIKNVKVLIAGESEKIAGGKGESEKEKLLKTIEKLRLNNVFFTGYIDEREINQFYSTCDVFVLPSTHSLESFGIVQVEAMLCGTPVVATDLPGIRIPVKVSKMGLLVRPKNSRDLARAIIKILKNKKQFVKPRKKIVKSFSLKETIKKYGELLAS